MAMVFKAKDGSLEEIQPIYERRETCRACYAKALVSALDLGPQFLPRFVPEADFGLPKAPLHLVRCVSCGLLQLEHTVKDDLLFRRYWYRSSINQTMKDALDDLMEHGLQYHHRGKWLDIGANDGYLLSRVPKSFHKTACEPAEDFRDSLKEAADVVLGDYFDAQKLNDKYDIITSAACFYDVDDPGRFVADVAKSLSPEGVWINQLNDAPTMLKSNAFDSICHEHLCYYDVHTLDNLYRQYGLNITRVQFNDVNGGSVRVSARKASRYREDLLGIPRTKQEAVEGFSRRIGKWKLKMLDLCEGPLATNLTYAYGASTKGTVLLQYLGATCFRGVADKNPLKLGLKMAGSWLPIVSEDEMRHEHPDYVFVLPWGLARNEFLARESRVLDDGAVLVFPLPNIELVL